MARLLEVQEELEAIPTSDSIVQLRERNAFCIEAAKKNLTFAMDR